MALVYYSAEPLLRYRHKTNNWRVEEAFIVSWYRYKDVKRFIVPEGFVTDLASIPQIARSFIPQVGPHLQAAIAHDYTYENEVPGIDTKYLADVLFYDGMLALGVDRATRRRMYNAVKLGGVGRWGKAEAPSP